MEQQVGRNTVLEQGARWRRHALRGWYRASPRLRSIRSKKNIARIDPGTSPGRKKIWASPSTAAMPARSRLGPRRAGVPFCPAPSRTTRVKRAGRANGKGIFLLRGTASGEVVLFMRSPRRVDPSHVGALLETRKQHADCAVHVVDSNTRRAYVDDSYCTGQPDGGWYMCGRPAPPAARCPLPLTARHCQDEPLHRAAERKARGAQRSPHLGVPAVHRRRGGAAVDLQPECAGGVERRAAREQLQAALRGPRVSVGALNKKTVCWSVHWQQLAARL